MNTTNRQFELFQGHCKLWLDFWGISDWNIDFVHKAIDDGSGTTGPLATIQAMAADKYAIIQFNAECPEELLNDREIMHTAFHEVAELLMMDFWLAATSRFDVTYDQLTGHCHAVIARMSNAIFEDYYETYIEEDEDERGDDSTMASEE